MSNNNRLPVPYDPPNPSGYSLYRTEEGNIPPNHSQKPENYVIWFESTGVGTRREDLLILTNVFGRTLEQAQDIIEDAERGLPVILCSESFEAVEERLDQVREYSSKAVFPPNKKYSKSKESVLFMR
ncbi:MAG: hypothetical protein AAF549_05990 [Pseudomonadota bacterium]